MAYYIAYFDRYDTITDVCKYAESECIEYRMSVESDVNSDCIIQHGISKII